MDVKGPSAAGPAGGAPPFLLGLLVVSLLLNVASAVAIGFSNADRFHDGIWRSMPWTKGSCGEWSGSALLLVALMTLAAALTARVVNRRSDQPLIFNAGRLLFWTGCLQLGYWAVASTANFGASCID